MTRNGLTTALGVAITVATAAGIVWLSSPQEPATHSVAPPQPAVDSTPTTSSQHAAPPGTQVITVVGVDKSAHPAPGYVVESGDTHVDDCIASPAGGTSVVSCSPSAAGADVCWVGVDRQTLLCGTSPWEKKLLKTRSTTTISLLPPVHSPAPWGLVLADGKQCRIRNGGAWGGRADGYVGAYICGQDETEFVLAKADTAVVDTSAPMWSVCVGPLGDPDAQFPEPSTVVVTTAYFAGTP